MSKHILKQDYQLLHSILKKVDEITLFNQLLRQHLEGTLPNHCKVSKYDEKNCLFVVVENGAWATQLRFQIPSLMTKLKEHPSLKDLKGIICKIHPSPTAKGPKKGKRQVQVMSETAAKAVMEISKSIKDSRLQRILEKIASYK